MIKVCPDPQCEAVYHNCEMKDKHCLDCSGNIRHINEKTYWNKFSHNFFQYDYKTADYHRPQKKQAQLNLEFIPQITTS
jgi:arginine/ornithine N-succinyltransferase beta subunit